LLKELFQSFGFYHIALNSMDKRNARAFIKAVGKFFQCLLFYNTGEKLETLHAGKIQIGKPMYEDIIRTSSLSTIRTVKNKICMKKIFHLLWTFYSLDQLCKKYKPNFVVCDDIAYHENMFLRLWISYGAKIYSCNYIDEHIIQWKNDGDLLTRSDMERRRYVKELENVPVEAIEWSEKYLKERYEGKNGREIDRGAFAGKRVLSREEAIREIGLDQTKKNVVIMAHTFTDAVFNYGTTYFRDYYDWTEQTIKIASKINSVNWILKRHPSRNLYNESEDSIEDMYSRYQTPNIYLLSDEVSAESIRNFADVIITIGGNAGAEFACEGVPPVIVGKPYYCGFGYTIEPKTKNEYIKCLQNISDIQPLTEEQVIIAKKIFYLRNHESTTSLAFRDEFSRLITAEYQGMIEKIAQQYFLSNEGTQKYNNNCMCFVKNYFKTHDIRKCEYYRRGVLRAGKANEDN
ncbi:MAG: hypothetical protein K2J95_04155, partial [Lachnospiraceae bacterium]|nr:hypothetical protein [Lachnospiraceae bacterium]